MNDQAHLQPLPVKWIFDPSFHYTPSYATDLRKTFERVRRMAQQAKPVTREEHGS